MNEITLEQLAAFAGEYEQDKLARVARNALLKADITDVAQVMDAQSAMKPHFSIDIKTMPALSQGRSGRCWIFAGLNVFREIAGKKLNTEVFELSQNYTAFYDKLEKINFFMESVMELADHEWDERTLWWVLRNGVSDGGQWEMLTALIRKYGMVPAEVMPDSFQARGTRTMNKLINRRLRRFTKDIKEVYPDQAKISQLKDECLQECYNVLCTCFGVPPQTFSFEYVDKNGEYHYEEGLTPKSFYDKYIGEDLDDYVSIINSPTTDKPYYNMFTVKYLGSVVNNPIRHLNLPLDEMKNAILSQLKDKEVVWFGSDCGNYGNRDLGIWDKACYDYASLFGVDFDMYKEYALYAGESAMNHAMVLTGVNLINDKPTKWKIENSFGADCANKGYFTCSDEWFDQYVFQAVVHKKYLSEKALAALDKPLIELEPWDPMGTLAD